MQRRLFGAALTAAAVALAGAKIPSGVERLETEAGPVAVEAVAGGLEHPWALAQLPDGRLLVTERPGRLRIVRLDGTVSPPLAGTPRVFAKGQGGLLDVALDPDFATSRRIWLSFAEPGEGGATTALGRGRLEDDRIADFEVVFREEPRIDGDKHFGGRIVFTPDGHLFLTLGERFQFDPAQDPSSHLGSIVRLRADGSVPEDNPLAGRDGARAEIWSYGHRNVESAAIDPRTGTLWIAEMGPLGGDELNRPQPGRNHGWPVVSWGRHYDGRDIPDPPTRPDFADAVLHWTPVISPSGMAFYAADRFPAWRGSAFVGGLSSKGLVRIAIDGARATEEERLPLGARIRDVDVLADGTLAVVTDEADGGLWRIAPLR